MKLLILILLISSANCECDADQPTVQLENRYHNGYYYYEGEYFVDNATGLEFGCVCLKEACGRKCCPHGEAFDFTTLSCIDFNPEPEFNVSINFYIGRINCSEGEVLKTVIPFVADTFFVGNDGYLYSGQNPDYIYGTDKYCIDTIVAGRNDSNGTINPLICFKQIIEFAYTFGLNSTCSLISCFFIILTISVYVIIPELRNLHGMVLIAYLAGMFAKFVLIATLHIMNSITTDIMPYCRATAYIFYYSLLTDFFWLNVMCFDIWWTFSGMRSMGSNRSPRKQFYAYCGYAFGVPTALTLLLVILEHSDLGRPSVWRPNLQFHCFLEGKSALLYLYGPQLLTFVANIVFLILTMTKIFKIRKLTTKMKKSVKEQQRCTLYIKLFAVMGIAWILEVISEMIYPERDDFREITDVFNNLMGLWTFILFVCKKNTLKLLKRRPLMAHRILVTMVTEELY